MASGWWGRTSRHRRGWGAGLLGEHVRKNYAGSRSEAGVRVAALFFGPIATARDLGIAPYDYLVTAATRAHKNPGSVFTPWEDYA